MESKRKLISRYRQGDSISKLSRESGISRPTIRKIVNTGAEEAVYMRSQQPHKVLGLHIDSLEKLLRTHRDTRPKLTAKHFYEYLCLEGYTGSYSAVCRYVKKWRYREGLDLPRACVPLHFSPGEAYQFDWSHEKVIIRGDQIDVKACHFILCYSRKRFCYIYPNETQEMLFDAHVRAFEYFGGTPVRGIYDNMKTAVSKVLRGTEREWNDNFERLCAHYMVEPTACTPARGNEKGIVENQVKISRREFFTPMPQGDNLGELNDILVSQLNHYNATHKHPQYKEKTLNDIYVDEKDYLVSCPHLFDSCKRSHKVVHKDCLIHYDRNEYSVSSKCVGKNIEIKIYADKLIFIYEGQEVGRHERRFTRGGTYYKPEHYFSILRKKPGALRNGEPFMDMELPLSLQVVQNHLLKHRGGSRDFAHILSYIPNESIEKVTQACQEAIDSNSISKDIIINILLRSNDTQDPEVITVSNLPLKEPPESDCNKYNNLLSEVSVC